VTDARIRRETVRIAVVDAERRLLLLRRRNPRHRGELWWELPGGRVYAGEDHAGAAVRELREETGISVDGLDRRIGVIETEVEVDGRLHRQRETVFVLLLGETPEIARGASPSAHPGHRWWPPDEDLPRVRVNPPQLARLVEDFR
jgi:8-oxo-dGTP pyrophosphatase MutT (NUDIX family)